MFIELDVWIREDTAFEPRTINVQKIEDFYPEKNHTLMWIKKGMDSVPIKAEQTYNEVRNLLSNVSLLVNE